MIYISLCCLPDRIYLRESFQQCLDALINQHTSYEYKVLLCIPNKFVNYDDFTIPDWLLDIVNKDDRINIIRHDIDYGPISNILYPIQFVDMDDDDVLIVCDDDHLYHHEMVEYHMKKLQEYPDNHCICFRGNDPKEMRTWYQDSVKIGKLYNSCVLFPTSKDIYLRFPDHWHSVSYRRKLLKTDLLDVEFLSMTWNNDILMGYYAWKNNFYYLCASYDQETDYRPVNYDGRGSHSFPIVKPLPYESYSGCNRWRAQSNIDIWQHPIFSQVMKEDQGIIRL
jgi:hypothetical protein